MLYCIIFVPARYAIAYPSCRRFRGGLAPANASAPVFWGALILLRDIMFKIGMLYLRNLSKVPFNIRKL
jgi:hypothetical protein